nr:MAG TPA: hypothetical protein [Caudoviricetes sp.]
MFLVWEFLALVRCAAYAWLNMRAIVVRSHTGRIGIYADINVTLLRGSAIAVTRV